MEGRYSVDDLKRRLLARKNVAHDELRDYQGRKMNISKYAIRGITPLIMHNGQLADPLNEFSRALAKLTGQKQKTEKYHRDVSECEWRGGLYVDEDGHPCLPGDVIEACLVEGAKKYKLGKACKGGLIVQGDWALDYDGPKTVDALWKNGGFLKRAGVRVGQSRIIRSRPIFTRWACTFEVNWDPELIKDKEQLDDIVDSAGLAGICEWRPKYGRFEVES